jgi:hypothetical protein
MTTPLLALVVAQAAFLLWSSVNLSNLFLQPNKGAPLFRFVVAFGLPLAIAWFGRELDPDRVLCGWIDCVALAVGVGLVRLWAVNRETDRLLAERARARAAALEELAAARREYEAETIRAAAADLEAQQRLRARRQPSP